MLFSGARVVGFVVGIYSKLWTPQDKLRGGCSGRKVGKLEEALAGQWGW